MKKLIFQTLIIIAALLPAKAVDTKQQFIRKEGTYKIAPKMTLIVSRDATGTWQYTFDRFYQDPQASAQVKHEDKLTEPFLFYWDEPGQILWQATAKQIHAHTPKGITFYENNSSTLKIAPDAFRSEVRRVFKSQ